MTNKEAKSWLKSIEDQITDEEYINLYSSINDDPDTWFMQNVDFFKNLPGYRKALQTVGKPEERLEKIIKDDISYDYTDNEKWDLMDEAGIESEDIFNKALENIKTKKFKEKSEDKKVEEWKSEQQAKYERQNAVNEYQHNYFGMSKDNPLNKGLNKIADFMISPTTRNIIAEDPNNTGKILGSYGTDVAGTTLDFSPIPGLNILGGPIVRGARDIALTDKDLYNIAKERGGESLSNLVLSNGLKGIPGIKDIGVLHTISEKVPTDRWNNIVKESKKDVGKFTELPKYDEDILKWIEKQPEKYKQRYMDAAINNPSNMHEAVLKAQEDIDNEIMHDAVKQVIAEEWVKNNKIKAGLGGATSDIIKGVEKSSAKELNQQPSNQISNPEKTKIKTEEDAINWAIKAYQKQWEAGFTPKPIEGDIIYEAWKKWNEEK